MRLRYNFLILNLYLLICHEKKHKKAKTSTFVRIFKMRKCVIDRDKKCMHCNTDKKLLAHHIIPWKESIELRFDINNGLTLCRSCHMKHHYENATKRFFKGHIPWNKGIPMKPSTKQKQRKRYEGKTWIIDSESGRRKWIV
jgi:hypothetical protein